MIVTVSILR